MAEAFSQNETTRAPRVLRAFAADRWLSRGLAPTPADRYRFAALIVGIVLCHVGVVALWLSDYAFPPQPLDVAEEIPVEVVQEQPPPPQPPEPTQPQKKDAEHTPPPIDLKPAYDAPKATKIEKAERETLQDSASGGRADPKAGQADNPTPDAVPDTAQASAPDVAPDPSAQKPEDRPNAEAIARAEEKRPVPENVERAPAQAPSKAGARSLDQLMAAYSPTPEYRLGGAPLPSPVTGGGSNTNYLSILYGLIMPKMKLPPNQPRKPVHGAVIIYIDTAGNVLHEAVITPSGSDELDMAAINAVRNAAPFPRPPRDLPPVRFTYGTESNPKATHR